MSRRPDAGYALTMSAEIHDWLAELRDSDPVTAAQVGQALAELMTRGGDLGDPLVVSAAEAALLELLAALDRSYEQRLEEVTAQRRRAADATTPEATDRLRAETVSLQERTEAFRTRKEVLKASYTAAHYGLQVDLALAASPPEEGSRTAIDSARARLADLAGQIERELGPEAWPAGLMELRPGAPGDVPVRILFAIEPAGTALLIAVLDGLTAAADHYQEAITVCADVQRRVRAGEAPQASAHRYDDPRSLLQELASRGDS